MGRRAVKARPSNLPIELTSFVGRREELREVKRLLTSTRLLTLTGSGGTGKTRLALRAAAEMARNFGDGVWLVPLAPIQDPLLVIQAVFNALGVQDRSAGLSLSTLTEFLTGKRLLLVLDNCEHLLDGCAMLAGTLLKSCADLQLLATSRQALGVAGEVRMPVPPMSLPEEGGEVSVERLLHSDAVGLLRERAAAVVSGFAVDAGNGAAVLRLCRRLDGIPLALELAAVRLGSLSIEQLHQGLAKELSILGRGNRGAEFRQQTLEATFGWSYGLLEEPERLLWARLSVFAGGFDQEAAIEVCSDSRLPAEEIVSLLGALVEKSMVKRESSGGAPRYLLLDTLRQYGKRRLRDLGEDASTQKRHFDWIRALARSIGAWDSRQPEMLNRMYRERDNLWAALEFCQRQPGEAAAASELAQNLWAYWTCRGPFSDVQRVLTSLVELTPEDSLPRARFLWVAADMAAIQNDYDACAELSRESLRIGTRLKDVEVVGWSLIYLSISRWYAGDLGEATELVQSALSMARLMQLEQTEMAAMLVLSHISLAAGDLGRAIEVGDQGLAMSKDMGELNLRGHLLNLVSQANWLQGDRQRAEAQAQEGAACKHALDDRAGLAILLETLAWMAAERGAHQHAATLLGCAEHVRELSTL
ncbi:MAG TPA: AAA family ATPase, partial [Candidatus Dormibacteraeota bacterium]|nr:AAA family ATPase [Candidatus Dormibacteraeota bacterium]